MNVTSLTQIGMQQLEKAREASSGRAAITVYGGAEHNLRQTLIAIAGTRELADHANPGEATLYVIEGSANLLWGDQGIGLNKGDYVIIPNAVHSVQALEDSVLLLTVSVHR